MKAPLFRYFTLLFFTSQSVLAQDPHFSQYHNLPLTLNPAHTGNGIEHVRTSAVYRNQWASVTSPFTTQGFMIDKSVGRFGFGLTVIKNGAGRAGMNQVFLNGNLAYHIPAGKYGKLSGALQAGMFQKSFNPSDLTFDSQYLEDAGFDPSLSSGELFYNTGIIRPDLGFGIMYQRGLTSRKLKFKPFGGASYSHVNMPKESFFAGNNTLPVRQTYHFGAGIQLTEKTELKPLSVVMIQDHHHELYAGAMMSYLLPNLNKLQFGMMMRNNDAVIAYAGYQISNLFIGTSYDLNTSSMKKATGGKGGFEVTLSYIPKRKISKAEELPKSKEKVSVKHPKFEKVLLHSDMPAISNPAHELSIAENRAPVSPFGKAQRITPAATPVQNVQTDIPAVTPSAPASSGTAPVMTQSDTLKTKAESKTVATVKPEEPVKEIMADNTPAKTETAQPKAPALPDETKPATRKTKKADEVRLNDIDKDGVADDSDDCPYVQGTAAMKGCPDSDGDGIADHKDRCPMEYGLAERNGCPAASETTDKTKLIKQFRNIEFETGKAIIRTPDIYDIIEYAIDVMYQYPNSTIILTGHTDSEGDELHNMKLSEARVNTVKRYLTGQGVSEKRIKTVFYGETMPLMDNSTEYGKARNRRVEINIIR
jgi:type IX secretion system PorP/SprF family membrane protein